MTDDQRKHLDFIQAVITRQAGNSFLIKGWALTVASAFYGFAVNRDAPAVALIGVLVAVAFGYLDAFFLRQERLFRCLYADAITTSSAVPAFSMVTAPYKDNDGSRWRDVLRSRPLLALFGVIIATGIVIAAVTAASHPSKYCRSAAANMSSSSPGVPGTSGQMSPRTSPAQRGSTCT